MDTRWLEGVFLGFNRSSNTYVVATDDGVVSCRSLYRKPIENRWAAERIMQLKSTQWTLRKRAQLQALLRSAPAPSGDPPAPRTEGPLPKAFRISYNGLVEHGFLQGCPQRDHNVAHGRSQDGMSHAAECRASLLDKAGDLRRARRPRHQ